VDAGLHFVLPVSDGPGPSALPAWRGGGCTVTLPHVFPAGLSHRASLRWRHGRTGWWGKGTSILMVPFEHSADEK